MFRASLVVVARSPSIENSRKLNAKMVAVFFHCVVRADACGNVNREQNKWHQAPVRLESGGTSFP